MEFQEKETNALLKVPLNIILKSNIQQKTPAQVYRTRQSAFMNYFQSDITILTIWLVFCSMHECSRDSF
jgi:hypothetical protein